MEQVDAQGRSQTIIHFVFNKGGDGVYDWRIACMPNMLEFHATPFHQHYMRTDAAAGVTCPSCKKTQEYEKAAILAGIKIAPKPVQVTPKFAPPVFPENKDQ